jgi:putative (di)nucleoside polyphosphate hydrolase
MSGSSQFSSGDLPEGYRPCAGIFLLNNHGQLFAGRRHDANMDAFISRRMNKPWQLPQGGIDPGETPAEAALREMREEIGTNKALILAESQLWHCYDVPPEIAALKWSGKYRGQAQKWFAMRFYGEDSDINIFGAHPEFDSWKWVDLNQICDLVVAFKRDVYARIVEEFRPHAVALQKARRG